MCTHCTRRQFLGASAVGGMALAAGHLAAGERRIEPPASGRLEGPDLRDHCRQAGGQQLGPFGSGDRGR